MSEALLIQDIIMDRHRILWKKMKLRSFAKILGEIHCSKNEMFSFHRKESGLNLRHKLSLMRSIILPILTTSIAWGQTTKMVRETLKLQENISPRCVVMCCQWAGHAQGSEADTYHRGDE